MVENTAGHFETHDAMAAGAIDVCYRMADCLTLRRSRAIRNMAGVACYTRTHNSRAGVVGVATHKTGSGMTVAAVRASVLMNDRICLTYGYSAVVAASACSNNI